MMDEKGYCFIVGSPRSGTTILGEVLGANRNLAQFYEPYFIWEHHIGPLDDDLLDSEHATPQVKNYVRREFDRFLSKTSNNYLIEKSPENSFRIPFVNTIFPNSKWIHIVRNGYDSIASINNEWLRRQQIVDQSSLSKLYQTFQGVMVCHPYWRNRFQLINYELRNQIVGFPRGIFNKAKWKGKVGWGPRFRDWEKTFNYCDNVIEFNAYQWVKSIEAVREGFSGLSAERTFEVKYEHFIDDPCTVTREICCFLDVPFDESMTQKVSASNVGVSYRGLSNLSKKHINPIISNTMMGYGYKVE